jgi:alkylated DNA repair dioxygenase AlkB
MAPLFPIAEQQPRPTIAGLSYHNSYITATEESELLAAIDAEPWDTTWKRRRQHYGVSYGKADGSTSAIPTWARPLVRRLHDDGIGDRPFDQMLVNEYFPGQGISMHKDYEPFDRTVVSISLLSDCVMEFRHVKSGQRESILLERCSLLVLSDEARYEWQHGIAARKTDRWQGTAIPRSRRLSVTFRLLKRGASMKREASPASNG